MTTPPRDINPSGAGTPRVANLGELTRGHIETYLGEVHAAGRASSSVLTAYAGLQEWATDLEDTAILRALLDTGVRAAECTGLTVDDVNFDDDGPAPR